MMQSNTAGNSASQKIVLIVEDDNVNYLLFETILTAAKDLNIKCMQASNGPEAIESVRQNHIDLVLMDIKMPDMDGYEASSLIKEIKPDLPIIVQTAFSAESDKAKAKAAGCEFFISKPIEKQDLIDAVRKFLFPA
jgi:two-component system cell cycle response regulator DivK